ncbi:DUF2586 family protein [Enterobacter sp. WCHEn045836]|uniref:DUF2586 domain-containing protein n=1 Tax=Enterobacter sp. WCHEn045836 TaxID=2497434 RepID=UPI000F84AE43|nr:DUF2586 domain-containing protein [Enterobacter sp. WCHEn045836]RTP98384.1 DUF2586 family protein [Enterobacter sp. WCHEn045836]
MTWPSVDINQINNFQGEVTGVEQVMLFVGLASGDTGDKNPLIALGAQSDIDKDLELADASLLEQVRAAQLNGGQNWLAFALMLEPETEEDPQNPGETITLAPDWVGAIELAAERAGFEGVLICSDIADIADGRQLIGDLSALRESIINSLGRRIWFICTVAGPMGMAQPLDWAGYREELNELQKDLAANAVQLVPSLWGNEAGVLSGRLCNRSVTIADSPARVATGALLGMGIPLPVDKDGAELSLAYLRAFHDLRYSVPMWYPDFEGLYWSDGLTLEVKGGDYEAIEYLRIMDKVARRVRLQAIPKIADRRLNSTPVSIASHQTYFGKTLREMSRTTELSGVTFPGEIEAPKDGDITITWTSKIKVVIGITARPYGSPKQITVNIGLDRTLED